MGLKTTEFIGSSSVSYVVPDKPSGRAPSCTVRLEWLTHGIDGRLRGDLQNRDLVQMANYLVGGEPNQSGHVRAPDMFTRQAHSAGFAQRWMAKAPLSDGAVGYDPSKANWKLQQAWCYELATADVWDGKAEFEPHHYRLVLSPDPEMWRRYGMVEREQQAEFARDFTSKFVDRVEDTIGQNLHAVSSVHLNTDKTHSHTLLRGLTREGAKVIVPPKYRREYMRWEAMNLQHEMLKARGYRRAG